MKIKKAVFKSLQGMMRVSDTERQALEAGTVGWEKGLFIGQPDWQRILHENRTGEPSPEARAFLENQTDTLCAKVDKWGFQENRDLSPEAWNYIKDQRFMGMSIPKDHGGLGFNALERSDILVKIASRDTATSVMVMVPNSIGLAEFIERWGTPKQKEYYLPKFATGEETTCLALTESFAASDAANIQSRGTVIADPDSPDGVRIIVNCDKRYSTMAPIATRLGVIVKVEDPDNLLGKGTFPGHTVCILPSDQEGVDNSLRHDPSVPFPNGPVTARDVSITTEQVVGGKDGIGKGWAMVTGCLSEGRANSLPSQATAGAYMSAYVAALYTGMRSQFNVPLADMKALHPELAQLSVNALINETVRKTTLEMVNTGEKPAVASAISKVVTTENLRDSVNRVSDILGGKDIMRGPKNFMEDVYRALRIALTVEGANILTDTVMTGAQGDYRNHPHLVNLDKKVQNEDWGIFSEGVKAAITTPLKALFRAVAVNATLGLGTKTHKAEDGPNPLQSYQRKLNRASASFAAIMVPNAFYLAASGKLKTEGAYTRENAQVKKALYTAASILRQMDADGYPEHKLEAAKLALDEQLYEAQQSMHRLTRADNSPFELGNIGRAFRPAQWVAARMTGFSEPTSKQHTKVATALVHNEDRLADIESRIFVPKDPNDPIAQLRYARDLTFSESGLLKKLKQADRANGLKHDTRFEDRISAALENEQITPDEFARLSILHEAQQKVIAVDAYDKHTWELAQG